MLAPPIIWHLDNFPILQFRKERLTFSNQWEALEFQIKKQDDEIDRLKNTQKVITDMESRNLIWHFNRQDKKGGFQNPYSQNPYNHNP